MADNPRVSPPDTVTLHEMAGSEVALEKSQVNLVYLMQGAELY